MAVHSTSGTLTASTAAAITLTSWAPYIAITVGASPAGSVSVTTDGSTATAGGADTETVASGTTVVVKNFLPKPELTTGGDSTGGLLPSTPPVFPAGTTKLSLISAVAAVYSISLVNRPGAAIVLA